MKNLVIVVVLAFILMPGNPGYTQNVGGEVGQFAPDFALNHVEGSPFWMSDVRGEKPIYLVFWATWCPACKREIPRLKQIREKYGHKIELIAINIGKSDSLKRVSRFIKKHEMTYRNLYDEGSKVTKMYGVVGLPSHFIIDLKGRIHYRGSVIPKNLDQIIKEIETIR